MDYNSSHSVMEGYHDLSNDRFCAINAVIIFVIDNSCRYLGKKHSWNEDTNNNKAP